jgi:hypothetical protein
VIDPFTRTRFHPDLKLETWYPEGVLDRTMAAFMVRYVGFDERIIDEPFNRFADLSKLTGLHLDFMELAELAAKRREAYKGRLPVKTAFLATSELAYGVVRMFASLMETSPIEVQVFRNAEDAAQWLGVPVEALRAEET